ncbi:Peptidase M28 [Moelleriella libera RCEF 2490]|uniref:Peptide hydrolase n=1 Tax=Moelleriella libera RCEF 2490 TaxID=1081109 RepID=A0A167XL26_9HYPO|nr:Peptidase M28 [Moelleriella libera RCEF 2490]
MVPSSLLAVALFAASPVLAVTALDDDALRKLPSPGDDFDIHSGKLLAPILTPRVPGTEGNRKVQSHLVDFFKSSLPDWELLWQNSTQQTPLEGNKTVSFSNLIFRRDPPGSRPGDVARLTLVAHFDSLISPEGFVGAIDSAAPCAMLLHVARSIDAALTAKWKAEGAGGADDGLEEKQGVQILFLDGEEAFVHWTATDSLYGARSLAEEWESQPHPATSVYHTPLHSISLFVLLDLLGSAEPSIPSYFLPTHWTYQNMATLEKRMRELGLLESKPAKPFLYDSEKQADQFYRGGIEDDHIPFMARGVDVLHIIPTPFPAVWHQMSDDGEHLDMPTTRDWARIATAFTAEWLDLGPYLPQKMATRGEPSSETTGSIHGKRTEL